MKTKSHAKPATRHARSNGAAHDDVIENAKKTAREAREMVMEQAVNPALRVLRDAGEQLEQGVHEAMEYVDGTLKQVKSQASKRPLQTIACAIGAGLLMGFLLGRRQSTPLPDSPV
jgi:ElaB/YqjD/DUF883 family membrane-anchored ribosome-binding protein